MVACSQPNSDVVIGAADASGSFVSDRSENKSIDYY